MNETNILLTEIRDVLIANQKDNYRQLRRIATRLEEINK